MRGGIGRERGRGVGGGKEWIERSKGCGGGAVAAWEGLSKRKGLWLKAWLCGKNAKALSVRSVIFCLIWAG